MFALVYTKSTLFPLEILDFFNEFLKSGIRWNEPLDYLTTHTSLSPIQHGCAPGFVNYKKGALNSQPQVISLPVLGSCLPMVGGSLQLLPPLKLLDTVLVILSYILGCLQN